MSYIEKISIIIILGCLTTLLIKMFLLIKNNNTNNIVDYGIEKNDELMTPLQFGKLIMSSHFEKSLDIYKPKILILISKDCPYCKEIFEIYWNEFHSEINNYRDIFILVEDIDENSESFLKLYDYNFNILKYDRQFLAENSIDTAPSFIYLNEINEIILKTPNVYSFFNLVYNSNSTFKKKEEVLL
ncbi:hypothetical protein [Lysinibacillus irui]|uniref:Thioredoxin-like fold domain-containing protein n=1 Tax=Lysinibacillus irui TaxID=2998077 RepID=A0AAJ5UXJ4_9BACI|nr:hypothetical protein [Lysinibacillus irui]WDV08215.1 hypothetical protein OU989_06940 [Lysinibacillus irui]